MKNCIVLVFSSLALAGFSKAAGYSANFDSGYNTANDVSGQQGWLIDDPKPELSFFINLTTASGTSTAGAVGGFYEAPTGDSVRLSHSLSLPFNETTFGVDMAVVSSTAAFPSRDTFQWSLSNPSGTNLITFSFEPSLVNPALLNIAWNTGTGSKVFAGSGIGYDAVYDFDVAFTAVGGNVQFAATVVGSNTFNFGGTLSGLNGQTLAAVGANFVKVGPSTGDNYLIFDNLAVVPEPSAGMMMMGALALPLIVRRRKRSS